MKIFTFNDISTLVMRRVYFATFFVVILFSNPVGLMGQSPIIGYDKVAWGTSIQGVKQFYPTINEIASDEASIGIRAFEQRGYGSGIESRRFYFFQGKLYSVIVNYGETDEQRSDAIWDKIESVYGRLSKEEVQSEPHQNGIIENSAYIVRYATNLCVRLMLTRYIEYGKVRMNVVLVMYRDEQTLTLVEDARKKRNYSQIQL